MYDEWLTDRSREAIELSKFSFVQSRAPSRLVAIGTYSSTVSRGADAPLAGHARQTLDPDKTRL